MVHILLLKCTLVPTTCLNFFSQWWRGQTQVWLRTSKRLYQLHAWHRTPQISFQAHPPVAAPTHGCISAQRRVSRPWTGGENCDRQIPFSISWWKLAEARAVWFQWSSKDWGRAIRRTPGLPFWISGLIVEKTCGSESSRATQKHRNNQHSLKGTH